MPPTTAAIRRFADQFSGEIIRRDDPGYDDARVVWNGMIDRYPEVVARPTNADDVVAAVRFGREEELPIAVRSGGHSIPGLSTCDDGIVIDLSRMNGARVDAAERTAWVNGGALLGELDREAQAVGLVCPVGVVSHTGVAGLTLGGGMGRLQRKHGYTIDNLLGVELVTADGRQVRASDEENADLFWGLRGAGANFGIATAFRFRLHPLAWPVTHGTLAHPIERAGELAACFRELIATGPDELWGELLARALGGRQPDRRGHRPPQRPSRGGRARPRRAARIRPAAQRVDRPEAAPRPADDGGRGAELGSPLLDEERVRPLARR